MNIYQERLLEHYNDPKNYGDPKDLEVKYLSENLSCGDSIELGFNIVDKKIDKILFKGEGCSVAIASASVLTEHVKGMEIEKILKMSLDDVVGLLGIELTLSRLKCAGLGLDALKKGIGEYLDQT